MHRTSRQCGARGSSSATPARYASYVASLVLGMTVVLLYASPARGLWLRPDMLEPYGNVGGVSSRVQTDASSQPTRVTLPDQARVPVLMYHYVSELPPNPDRYRRDLTVVPENFRTQLQYLADAGYSAVTLTDVYLHLTEGYPLPERPVALTFDDGYRDAYEIVFPLLLEYGFTATFFVLATPAHYEWEDYLTWSQMQEMAEAGMEIQGHGRDHVDLRGRSFDYLVYQILGIQEAIHYHVGRPARFFCYPSGRYDGSVVAVLKSAGYWGAVTTQWGQMHTRDGLFQMPRIRIRRSTTLTSFVSYLEDQ